MQQELILAAITQAIVGTIFLTFLLVLLYALRQETRANARLSGIVVLTLAILGLWSFGAFAKAYVTVRTIIVSHYSSKHVDSGSVHDPIGA